MQYGQPWLPALVMAAKVSYLAGPQVVDCCPASGPTQPAERMSVAGSPELRAGLRTPITWLSPRLLPPASAVSSPVNRLPSGSVYVPSGSGRMRRILPLGLLVWPAVRRASAKETPL